MMDGHHTHCTSAPNYHTQSRCRKATLFAYRSTPFDDGFEASGAGSKCRFSWLAFGFLSWVSRSLNVGRKLGSRTLLGSCYAIMGPIPARLHELGIASSGCQSGVEDFFVLHLWLGCAVGLSLSSYVSFHQVLGRIGAVHDRFLLCIYNSRVALDRPV